MFYSWCSRIGFIWYVIICLYAIFSWMILKHQCLLSDTYMGSFYMSKCSYKLLCINFRRWVLGSLIWISLQSLMIWKLEPLTIIISSMMWREHKGLGLNNLLIHISVFWHGQWKIEALWPYQVKEEKKEKENQPPLLFFQSNSWPSHCFWALNSLILPLFLSIEKSYVRFLVTFCTDSRRSILQIF